MSRDRFNEDAWRRTVLWRPSQLQRPVHMRRTQRRQDIRAAIVICALLMVFAAVMRWVWGML